MSDEKTTNPELLAEARRLAERQSVYWTIDHPAPNMFDRAVPPKLDFGAMGRIPASQQLEGARDVLESAKRMLEAARRQLENIDAVLMRVKAGVRVEGQHLVYPQLRAVFGYDIARARAELVAAEKDVRYWGRLAGIKAAAPTDPLPEPDRRLPREPGEDAEELDF